jgi:hypothetical protein
MAMWVRNMTQKPCKWLCVSYFLTEMNEDNYQVSERYVEIKAKYKY